MLQMEYVEKLTLKEAIEDGVSEMDSWRLMVRISLDIFVRADRLLRSFKSSPPCFISLPSTLFIGISSRPTSSSTSRETYGSEILVSQSIRVSLILPTSF